MAMFANGDQPIGVFDSGIGGLSVLRELQRQLPHEAFIYVGDQAHIPYGARSAAEIQAFSAAITRFLLQMNVKGIVVACNTATAAAINHLRAAFPDVNFVGMEPAVKPGAQQTRSGKVGVLATAGTFESQRYAELMHRFARDVVVYEDPCLGLVEHIEHRFDDKAGLNGLLRGYLAPMLAAGVDTLILGCTHYPFVAAEIQAISGPDVRLIDPAPAVARQTGRILPPRQRTNGRRPPVRAFTSGTPEVFASLSRELGVTGLQIEPVVWQAGELALGRDLENRGTP